MCGCVGQEHARCAKAGCVAVAGRALVGHAIRAGCWQGADHCCKAGVPSGLAPKEHEPLQLRAFGVKKLGGEGDRLPLLPHTTSAAVSSCGKAEGKRGCRLCMRYGDPSAGQRCSPGKPPLSPLVLPSPPLLRHACLEAWEPCQCLASQPLTNTAPHCSAPPACPQAALSPGGLPCTQPLAHGSASCNPRARRSVQVCLRVSVAGPCPCSTPRS